MLKNWPDTYTDKNILLLSINYCWCASEHEAKAIGKRSSPSQWDNIRRFYPIREECMQELMIYSDNNVSLIKLKKLHLLSLFKGI